ncbi:hypothetical protein pEaSNUABM37_00259 [Erwinia phage pEa_SNUABM_37]|nr:hypothetical protein pEaSNUABM37_00259 [Erwinia phage pEa_SNUABM_37]QXO10727.1 hypothetical protein pEaSNUABM48_00259 [Erwinia phage pEa_SNUABM_48]
MSRYYTRREVEGSFRGSNSVGEWNVGLIIRDSAILVVALIVLLTAGCPYYRVWDREQTGKAALAQAVQDRQITIEDARSKKEAAIMLADAEIERARGVAEANKIIGNSLKGNDAYLHYLWLDSLKDTKNQVIYVPTEANMPIMEAGRVVNTPNQ